MPQQRLKCEVLLALLLHAAVKLYATQLHMCVVVLFDISTYKFILVHFAPVSYAHMQFVFNFFFFYFCVAYNLIFYTTVHVYVCVYVNEIVNRMLRSLAAAITFQTHLYGCVKRKCVCECV